MPGREHAEITELALHLLPKEQREVIAATEKSLIKTYCKLPDAWYDLSGGGYEEAEPYCFKTDGIPFHYIPDTPVVPLYRYYVPDHNNSSLILQKSYQNDNWKHASAGFRFYCANSIEALQQNHFQDGMAYAGWLLHMLQDSGFGAHSMEGPYGSDFFILQRLFPEPSTVKDMPNAILGRHQVRPTPKILNQCRKPLLLGLTADEIALHLYTRYVHVTCEARKLSFQIVNNTYQKCDHNNDALFLEMYRNIALLCADVLYTILFNGTGKGAGKAEQKHLERVYLSDLEPIQRPWLLFQPYRALALVKNAALDWDENYIPLQLISSNADNMQQFEHGWAVGGHHKYSIIYEIPHNLYSKFTCKLGLHAIVADKGNVKLTLFCNGKNIFAAHFNSKFPSTEVIIDNPGGKLELMAESCDASNTMNNHVVMAEPLLHRG